ncbi:MAG: hypothetical protein ACRDO7_00715 [Nocardioidaceae bacterium]
MPEKDPEPRPENDLDPGASTQLFQAFVDHHEPEESGAPRKRAALVGAALVGLVIVVVAAWFLLGG